MSHAFTIRPARAGDAELLAPVMRSEDAAEVFAAEGWTPLRGLRESLASSEVAYALELGGELAALFGVSPGPRAEMLGPRLYDVVWLLTGHAVARCPVAFMRASRLAISSLLRIYPLLANRVDARYAAALRWARHLHAEVGPAGPWGASGLPFHLVIWRSPWV